MFPWIPIQIVSNKRRKGLWEMLCESSTNWMFKVIMWPLLNPIANQYPIGNCRVETWTN